MQLAVILAIAALGALVLGASLLLFHFTGAPARTYRAPYLTPRSLALASGPTLPRAAADELIAPEAAVAPVTLPSPPVTGGFDLSASYSDLPALGAAESQPSPVVSLLSMSRTAVRAPRRPLASSRPPTASEVGVRPLLLDLPVVASAAPVPAPSDPDPTQVMSRPPAFG